MEEKITINTTEELFQFIQGSNLSLNKYAEIVDKFYKLDIPPWLETTEGQSLEMTPYRKEKFIESIKELEERIKKSGYKTFFYRLPNEKTEL